MWHELRSFSEISKLKSLQPAWVTMMAQYHLSEKGNTERHRHHLPQRKALLEKGALNQDDHFAGHYEEYTGKWAVVCKKPCTKIV